MKIDLNPERILILQTAFIGDVILALPLLQQVRREYPEALIDVMVIPAAANLLATHPAITNLIVYDKRGSDRGLVNILRTIAKLRGNRYDLAIVPHRSFRSALLVAAAGIPLRVGFSTSAGRYFYNRRVTYRRDFHEIERNLSLLMPLGIDCSNIYKSDEARPHIEITAEDQAKVDNWLAGAGLPAGKPIAAIAAGSVWATKRWLPENFAQLAKRLAGQGFAVILIGGPQDAAISAEIAETANIGNSHQQVLNAAGQLSLRESAALIGRAKVLISNDSAPLHLAVAVSTPIVAIFGATVTDFGFYPYGKHDIVVENKTLPCRPCGIHGRRACPLGTLECMTSLSANAVFDAVQERLKYA